MSIIVPLIMAAAVHGAGPALRNPQQIAAIGDLSDNRLPSAHEGVVFVTMSVDPFGMPIHCDVARTSGYRMMDARTCTQLMARARFEPGRDEANAPIASTFSTSVRWSVAAVGSPGYLLDMTVEVGKLPEGAKQPVTAVRQVIAADGTLESCAVEASSGVAALDRIACKQAEGLAKLGPALDRLGKPARTLRVSHLLFQERPRNS